MESQALETLVLGYGGHRSRDAGMCAMEAVAWLNGEAHSDAPSCTASPIRKFVIATNDWCNDEERQQLKPYLARLISTSSVGRGADVRASFMFADWAVREVAPAALDALFPAQATILRALAPIIDRATALAGRNAAYATADAAAATDADAAYAAYAAAYAAAATDAAAYAADAAGRLARADGLACRLDILNRVLIEAYAH